MTEIPEGVWRHHKGHLYQVLFEVHLFDGDPLAGYDDPVTTLFHARDSTNGSREGREVAVHAVTGDDGPWLAAWPPGGPDADLREGVPGVAYMGLTLDGTPKPGLRVRVRDLAEFTGTVALGFQRKQVPRFEYLARAWAPGLGDD